MNHPLIGKIVSRSLRVAVIGLGYVGLTLAVTFAEAGFDVVGIDIDRQKVDQANQGKSSIPDIESTFLQTLLDAGRVTFTTDFSALAESDVMSICVPTPLSKAGDPDLSSIIASLEQVRSSLCVGKLILLESTTYPGTTEEVVLPMLEATGLKVGVDFFLAFSPERLDPGNPSFGLKNTPKVVGGITPMCTQIAHHFYRTVIEQVVPVSSARVAEMTKLLENTFRAVNIGLANEIALICEKLQISVWEVIDAAATKPFGFLPFLPGPGVGGHCIPIDPHYLFWKLKTLDYRVRFVELASEINKSMPHYVVNKISTVLNEHQRCLNGSIILLLGVAYKGNSNDVRESPALDIIQTLLARQAVVQYSDEYVPSLQLSEGHLTSQQLSEERLQTADCVVLVTNHAYFDVSWIVQHARLVVDTRNMTKGIEHANIYRL